MKSIERTSMVCKMKVECGGYTMNHTLGCSYGCKCPCYAMMMAKRFTTDSLMYEHDEVCEMSMKTIRRLDEDDIFCIVLSKGVLPAELAEFSEKMSMALRWCRWMSRIEANMNRGRPIRRAYRRVTETSRSRMQDLGEHGALPVSEYYRARIETDTRACFIYGQCPKDRCFLPECVSVLSAI